MEDFDKLIDSNFNRLINLHCNSTKGCYQCATEIMGEPFEVSWLSLLKPKEKIYQDLKIISAFLDECELVECTCENSKLKKI